MAHWRVMAFWLLITAVLCTVASSGTPQSLTIGEINSFSGIAAPFTGPYRAGVEMAVDEVNARGGLLGRKVEVLFRDDKGDPSEAVKQAQDLAGQAHVALIAGTFLSNVGLAVSDWAKHNQVLFVAAEPLTEALTWSRGHDYVFRVRPNTFEQGRMLAGRAAKMRKVRWATIGPNYEYGKRAWETFRDRLQSLQPEVKVVGEHWPPLGKLEPGPYVTAILAEHPDALYISLFGTDWLVFVREARKRGLFDQMSTVGILLGEPEYAEPLQSDLPEGMLVTGYPKHELNSPQHAAFAARFATRTGRSPMLGSLVGYITYQSIFAAIRKAASVDTWKMVTAFRDLSVETPIGSITFRASDGQSTMGTWVGLSKFDRRRGVGTMVDFEYISGDSVLPSAADVKKLRPAS